MWQHQQCLRVRPVCLFVLHPLAGASLALSAAVAEVQWVDGAALRRRLEDGASERDCYQSTRITLTVVQAHYVRLGVRRWWV